MNEDTLQMTMLFDFFGDMLTEKQREYYDLYHNEDLSLSEIAEKAGISRQGVYDIITRASMSLAQMEQKTGVVQRWMNMREELLQAEEKARELLCLSEPAGRSAQLAGELVDSLERMKG
jgi:predicted DNA-binding protein YlxM (UPF0122 family)